MKAYRISRLAHTLAGTLAMVVVMAGLQASVQAAQPPWKTVLDRAEFVLSSDERPPNDAAAWMPVSLPDEWRRANPGAEGQGWYRFRLDLAQAPATIHAILIKFRRSYQVDYFVNGDLVGGSRDVATTYGRGMLFRSPVYITVPPHLLRAGDNVIHVRMQATAAAANMHGLGPVIFGDAREVRNDYIGIVEQESGALRTFLAMAFAAGLIAICLWCARREDRVMLLLAVTYLSWTFATVWQSSLRWVELPPGMNAISQMYLSYALPPLAVILCMRTVNLNWPRFEATLWAYLAVEVTFPLWGMSNEGAWRLAWDAANTALLLTGGAMIMVHAKRPLRWSVHVRIGTLFLMAALMFSEFMRYLGWVDVESPIVRHYHVPLMIVGIGAAIFESHVLAVWRADKMHVALEQRIAEKTREIEANHTRVEEALREQALADERQRIINDMHDGLGASLIGLLRHVQSGGIDRANIEQRIRAALQELRIAIDALEPAEGGLATVLGNLRYRLEPLLERTGVRLEWEVAELPSIEILQPSAVFALQRIVLEAVANALKHSGATSVRLSARAVAEDGTEIRIEDNGRGFEPSQPGTGLGLPSMQARASRIGAQLEVASPAGAGTVVRLLIPGVLTIVAEDEVAGIADPRALPGLIPAPGAA